MNAYRTVSLGFFLVLAAVTLMALLDVGYIGIFRLLTETTAGWQVFVDLAAALILVLMFLWDDAKARGIRFWPWIIATFLTGSLAPLLFILVHGYKPSGH